MSLAMFVEKTPTKITEEVGRFCEEVAPGQTPVYVRVRVQAGAEAGQCHINVERHVQAHGGTPLYGWIIWQSAALLDAEFHCNWSDREGEVWDITPKADGETTILFVPEPTLRWGGRAVPSRRKARRSGPSLASLVAVMAESDKIRTQYLAGQRLSPLDTSRIMTLTSQTSRLVAAISGSWGNTGQQSRDADRRGEKKAERQRRKQQRRRGK